MAPDHGQRIQQLFQAALKCGPAERLNLLSQADPALRREVEAMLAPVARESVATATDGAASFTQLGPYKIQTLIGAGGMGEVFLAQDTRLHRTVAIKVLPADKIADPERRRRFLQEARAASALNHPNIVTLYDISSNEGVEFLVMEYVRGTPLDRMISPHGVPLATALSYATQIASALVAAHAAGIVHRDIKPANVTVTPESQVKVLDFGLAKLGEPGSANPNSETGTMEPMLTGTGVVMGTRAYMSPEQARGESVDARTDLFSFGALLYEMVTGRRAFPKFADWTPPAVQSLHPKLQGLILKLLEQDRELRYQTARAVLQDLQQLQGSVEQRRGSRRWWLAGIGSLLAALAAGVFLRLWPKGEPIAPDRWVQLTKMPDSVSQPALSPDGRMLTFIRGPSTFRGPGQVYVKILPDGEATQITHDSSRKMSPVFSPDGSRIAYTVNEGANWDTWVVPLVNGQPRLWLPNASGLVWLDKQRLLFSEIKDKDIHMAIVSAEENRAGARDLYVPPHVRGMAHRSYPSPDGKWLLVVEMERGPWQPCKLVSMNSVSPVRPVGPRGAGCTFAGWSPDGKWMYFSSSAGGAFHTWRQRFPAGQPEQITSGPTEEEGIAMAPDGRSFVTAVATTQSVVWVHDVSGERQVSLEGYSHDAKLTPDGMRLCYRILKDASAWYGTGELRVVELGLGQNEPLLPGVAVSGSEGLAYNISRDGQFVVAAVRDRDGKSRLWLASLDRRSPPRQIPNVEGDNPVFGVNGEIIFRSVEGISAFAYRVSQDGTGLRKVVGEMIGSIRGISQDGQWLVVRLPREEGTAITALPLSGGVPVRVISPQAALEHHLGWSPDGKFIFISVPTSDSTTGLGGRTYVVPLPPGQMFPPLPAGGFQSVAEIGKLPNARIIEGYNVAPGPTPDVYAFSRATVQRNLFQIPIH